MIYIKTEIKCLKLHENAPISNLFNCFQIVYYYIIMIEKVKISDLELGEIYAKGKSIDPKECNLKEIINSGIHVGIVIHED